MITVSFIWTVAIILIIVVASKSAKECFQLLLSFLLVLDLNQIKSTAAVIGSQEINCTDLVTGCLIVLSCLSIVGRKRIDKHLVMSCLILLSVLVLGCIWNMIFPIDDKTIISGQSWDDFYYGRIATVQPKVTSYSVLILFRVFGFCAIMCAATLFMSQEDYGKIGRRVFNTTKIQVIFAAVELLEKILLRSNKVVQIAQTIFPSTSSVVTTMVSRGSLTAIQGFTREFGHLAYALALFVILGLYLRASDSLRNQNKDIAWIILALVLMLLSGAFASLVYFVIIIGLYFGLAQVEMRRCNRTKPKKKIVHVRVMTIIIILITFIALTLFNDSILHDSYYMEKFFNVWDNLQYLVQRKYYLIVGTIDAIPRAISISESIWIFLRRPLLGVGLGVMAPYSGIGYMLANCGLAGTIAWFSMIRRYAYVVNPNCNTRFLLFLIVATGLLLSGQSMMYACVWLLFGGLLKDNLFERNAFF